MKISAGVYNKTLYLSDNQLGPVETLCPFCGSSNRKATFTLQNNPDIVLLNCLDCNASSASRIPTDDALSMYYGGYYKSDLHTVSGEKVTFNNAQRFGKHISKHFLSHKVADNVSILDFGGGDGSLSYAVALELIEHVTSVDITLIDYNDNPIVSKDSRITISRKPSLEEMSVKYDYIIASAVIEHIPTPRKLMDSLLSMLHSRGIFYARTPHIAPLMKLSSLIGIEMEFTYPGHIHDLGQDFWETYFTRIIPKSNFRILHSKPAIVETTLSKYFINTCAAYLFKAPWYLFGKSYKLVGGWEIFCLKS